LCDPVSSAIMRSMAKLIPLVVLATKIEARTEFVPGKGCRVWVGARNEKGYGRIWNGERLVYVHRLVWEIEHGLVGAGLDVLHDCPGGDDPACCAIEHLWCGTHAENMADMVAKGRARSGGRTGQLGVRGTQHSRSKLTDDQVREIRGFPAAYKGTEIARRYGVSPSLVYGIRSGRNWGWLK